MPKHSEHIEAGIRRAIRDAMAIDPLISMRQLQKVVEKKLNRIVEYHYLTKLVKKVQKETVVKVDLEKMAERVSAMREDFRLSRENLLRIAYGQTGEGDMIRVAHKDQIAAWKAIGMLSKILLDAEMDLGVFDRKTPIIDETFRTRALPPEVFEAMLRTAQVWKLPQDLTRKIEQRTTILVESVEVPKADPKAPPQASQAQNEAKKDPMPKGLTHANAIIRFEPQPDGTLKRVEHQPIIDPTRLIPADPELRLS